jgi:hypothetical protein
MMRALRILSPPGESAGTHKRSTTAASASNFIIGRLLYDSQLVFEDQFAALENDSQKLGTTGESADRNRCPVDA